MSGIEITRPIWLAALVVLPLVVYYFRRSMVHFAAWQRAVSLVLRLLLVVLLVGVLCGFRIVRHSPQQYVVFAVDGSLSIGDESRNKAEAYIEEARKHCGDARTAILPFAARPGTLAGEPSEVPPEDRYESNLAAAIAAARAAIPSDCVGRIVLLSDGNQTLGDAVAAARVAGVPIDAVPLSGPTREVYVSGVEAKTTVHQGEPFSVEVVVQSTGDGEVTLELTPGSREAEEEPRRLVKGENRFRLRRSILGRAAAAFTARISSGQDSCQENNEAGVLVLTTPKPKLLLVESRPVLAEDLKQALLRENVDVEVCGVEQIPHTLEKLQAYDLLILSNVPAASLSPAGMEVLQQYVRDCGGGLIVVGGDRAFTPGGYRDTTLEEILPVVCHERTDKPKPSLALVLVIDHSGSMKGESIKLAKQATRQAVKELSPRDKVGVIAFQDWDLWVSEILPCSERERENIFASIEEKITAGGGTNMYPAMEKAYLALNETFADRRHIIVMTDGLSHPGDFETLTRRMASSGITVSTVGLGKEVARDLLQDIARLGGGDFYPCDNADDLPKIFAQVAKSESMAGITEEPFVPKVAQQAEALAELDFGNVPRLTGYAETLPKPAGKVILQSEAGDPLLASWRYGLGTSVVFTSDIQSRWAAAWLQRNEFFRRFWVQLVRHAMRRDVVRQFALAAAATGRRCRVSLDAVGPEGRFLNHAKPRLKVVDPQRKSREMPLGRVGPGRYAAEFDTPQPGTYFLEATLAQDGWPACVGRGGLVVGYADELRTCPTNQERLREIAAAHGGQYDPRPAELFAGDERTVPRIALLWPWLLAAAVLIFLLDLTVKRIDLSRRQDS